MFIDRCFCCNWGTEVGSRDCNGIPIAAHETAIMPCCNLWVGGGETSPPGLTRGGGVTWLLNAEPTWKRFVLLQVVQGYGCIDVPAVGVKLHREEVSCECVC